MKARGGAKAIDLVTLLAENAKIMKRLREMEGLAVKAHKADWFAGTFTFYYVCL